MIFRDKTGAPALERVPNLFRVNPSRLTKCPKGERESVANCDITIQNQASGSQTSGINFQKCRLCLQVSTFASDSVLYQNSEITIAAANDGTSVTVSGSQFINTSIALMPSASSTNQISEINFNLSESSVRAGDGSLISTTGNITELNIDINSCNFHDIDGQGVISLANYGKLSLRVRDSRMSAINAGSYGIALSGGEISQTIFDINACRFDNIASKRTFIYLPHGGGKIIATVGGSSFTKVESMGSGSVLSIGEPISQTQSSVESIKSENSATVVTLSSVEIKNCSSSESGGAIYMQVGELHLRNCSFINNTARRKHADGIKDDLEKSSGGAIFASEGAVESIPVIWYNSQLFRLKGENGGYVDFHCPLGKSLNKFLVYIISGS